MESGIKEGLVLVNAMHITASVFINDDEPDFIRTTKPGSKTYRMNLFLNTTTTEPAKTMAMHT
jgi:hypothetical protein